MNTQFFTKPYHAAGKSVKKHAGGLASGSLAALLVSGAFQLCEKWLDSKATGQEAQAVEMRTNAQFKSLEDRLERQLADMKSDQQLRDQTQWNAIAKKQDKR